jgi:protein subunit release factor A
MFDRLEQMEQRFNDLQAQFSLPEVLNDHEKYQKIGKSLREIEAPVEKYRELKQVQSGLADARAMLAETDPDLRTMAEEEIACCPKIPMMRRTSSWRLGPGREATKRHCLQPRFSGCTRVSPSSTGGRSKCCRFPNPV